MTRAELLAALARAGYTGPTSYTKTRLEEILAAQTKAAAQVIAATKPHPVRSRYTIVATTSGKVLAATDSIAESKYGAKPVHASHAFGQCIPCTAGKHDECFVKSGASGNPPCKCCP